MMQSYSYALNYVFETHLIFDFKLHPLCLSQIEVLRFMVMFDSTACGGVTVQNQMSML